MQRIIVPTLFLVTVLVFGQSERLEMLQSSFDSADRGTKLEVLRTADNEDAETFGPLYAQALSYVINNAEDLSAQQALRDIAGIAVDRIAEGGYSAAAGEVWRLFGVYEETSARIEIAQELPDLVDPDSAVVDEMNEWVLRRNTLSRGGATIDRQVLAAMTEALGSLGSSSSFRAVLDVILTDYPGFISSAARTSLENLNGDPVEMAGDVVISRDIADRSAPFEFFMNEDYLQEAQKAELAVTVLDDALNVRPQSTELQEELRQIRFMAANVLRDAQHEPATDVLIRHFNETVLEYDRGRVVRSRVLEAASALGATGSEAAAQRLTEYLELLNTYTEIDGPS
ncbi:MAG TPA: hypothetical protein VJ932_07880, partial [Alkalispirochaeta sp.]|nr:hypothetical protein [Alkalispirochaeta sp.]